MATIEELQDKLKDKRDELVAAEHDAEKLNNEAAVAKNYVNKIQKEVKILSDTIKLLGVIAKDGL